ncbi:ABC transporter ATP-binding protein [Spirosoma sp. KCTC 42546]|uniref:ABC transporter ATP-binding protein n=1 Tax=Spirosoma sp. KCTC 42546 TaxID=2520506 RepID=UPI00115BDD7D|nr:ABC transporter ATP-binding protein [Spirosoma sp. KCTC 42546]QDK77074.1 ABC transporter ATP-binding protein [Spirosoma sp. KCTC 42546]
MLTVDSLTVRKGEIDILLDVSFRVNPGETVCILGRNGAGKTTLLRAIVGAELTSAGQSVIQGCDMHQPERQKVLSDIGAAIYPNSFYAYLSAFENLRLTQRYYGVTRFSVNEILHLFELHEVGKRPANQLSAGMKQRLLLALAFINKPMLLLLDEPFNAVDRDNTRFILRLLAELQREYQTTVILTSHSLPDVEAFYSRILLLKAGQLVADRTKDEVRASGISLTELYDDYA